MGTAFHTTDAKSPKQQHASSSKARHTVSPSSEGLIAQMMHLQKTIGNQAVLQLLQSQRTGPVGAPIQRKRTTRPGDAELTGLIGSAASDAVITGKNTDTEKGDAIWQHVKSQYDTCLADGDRYMTGLNDDIAKYKDANTKAALVSGISGKRAGNDAKFRDNYEHAHENVGGTKYRVNSKGYDPATSSKPTVGTWDYEGDYSNEFDLATGNIKASWNFADSDNARKAGKGVNNSEILWDQYKVAAEEHFKGDVDKDNKVKAAQKQISRVVRNNIINETTNAVMYMSYEDGQDWSKSNKTFSSGDEEFKALLGTPNCKSTSFMLRDHLDELEKTIDTIKVDKSSNIEITFKNIT